MNHSSSFKCPQCLTDVNASPDMAGKRIKCPVCKVQLTVPLSLGHGALFDDLFDEGENHDRSDRSPNDVSPEGPIEEFELHHDSSGDPTVEDSGAETKPPVIYEISSSAEPEVDSVIPLSDVVTADELEILDEQTAEPTAIPEDGNPDEYSDPFKFDEQASIRIDGISDGLLSPDSFFFKCPICDSHMQVNEDQVGSKVQCSDCHADVTVEKPKPSGKEDVWRRAATIRQSDDEEEFKLQDPVERPKIDYNIAPEFGLDAVQHDLLSPQLEPESNSETSPATPNQKRVAAKSRRGGLEKDAERPQKNVRTTPVRGPETASAARAIEGPVARTIELSQLKKFDFAGDIDLILRTLVTLVFLTLFFTLEESVWNTLQMEELDWGQKFVRYAPALVGSFVCFVLFAWFMSVTFSVVMRSVANGRTKVDEWVGFAPSEWMGSFLIFAISSWFAVLPGALLGYFAMKITGGFFPIPVFASLSFCLLLPVVLTSAFVNESVYNVFSPQILGSLTRDSQSWMAAYRLFLIPGVMFVVGVLVILLPGMLFSFLGSVFQVLGITLYAILIGMQARAVIASTPEDSV